MIFLRFHSSRAFCILSDSPAVGQSDKIQDAETEAENIWRLAGVTGWLT